MRIRKEWMVTLAFLLMVSTVMGQFVFEENPVVPVSENGKSLKYPWTGGFNTPQFSAPDLNNDGTDDLIVFDRTGSEFGRLIPFLNNGTPNKVDYTYAPKYRAGFPPVTHWMLMEDFDCDGIKDLITSIPATIKYYKGYYNSENELEFDSVGVFLYNSINSGLTEIFVSITDVPAITDVNNDGDLDVLTFDFPDGKHVEYFENQAMELTGTCADTIVFERYDDCWGKFYENTASPDLTLDTCGTPKRSLSGNTSGPRHAGSTLLAFDEDGDDVKELIIGDISYDRLIRVINEGTPTVAYVDSQDIEYPSYDVPYRAPIFPAAFYLDVDNDGLKDLIVAPNEPGTSENYTCIWYYKNVGTADSVRFKFQTDTLLVRNSIDVGEGAYPVFFDYNDDGLMDLVVGNYGYYLNGVRYTGSLALLENVGTSTAPAFEIVDRDYGNVSTFQLEGLYPAFGDLDDDGDEEMILGDKEGILHYFEDTSATGSPAIFALQQTNYMNIDAGQNAAPLLFDANGDDLLDLLIGERNGRVRYYENIGTASNDSFSATPTISKLGEINVREQGIIQGNATPVISTLDSTNTRYVVCGSNSGFIRVYQFEPDSIYTGTFPEVFQAYSGIDEGERTSVALHDLTGDGKLEMVVGNYRGGLSFYSQSDSIPVSITDRLQAGNTPLEFNVFPNPADNFLNVLLPSVQQNSTAKIEVINLLGQRLLKQRAGVSNNQTFHRLDTKNFKPGIYLIRVKVDGQAGMRKFVVE